MVTLGVILLILGLLLPLPLLTTIGVILIVVGAVLYLAPNLTGGRRLY